MSENPLNPFASISRLLQTHLSRFLIAPDCTTTDDDLTLNSLTSNPFRAFSSLSFGPETTAAAPPIRVAFFLCRIWNVEREFWVSERDVVYVFVKMRRRRKWSRWPKRSLAGLHGLCFIALQLRCLMLCLYGYFSSLYYIFICNHYLLTQTVMLEVFDWELQMELNIFSIFTT